MAYIVGAVHLCFLEKSSNEAADIRQRIHSRRLWRDLRLFKPRLLRSRSHILGLRGRGQA